MFSSSLFVCFAVRDFIVSIVPTLIQSMIHFIHFSHLVRSSAKWGVGTFTAGPRVRPTSDLRQTYVRPTSAHPSLEKGAGDTNQGGCWSGELNGFHVHRALKSPTRSGWHTATAQRTLCFYIQLKKGLGAVVSLQPPVLKRLWFTFQDTSCSKASPSSSK